MKTQANLAPQRMAYGPSKPSTNPKLRPSPIPTESIRVIPVVGNKGKQSLYNILPYSLQRNSKCSSGGDRAKRISEGSRWPRARLGPRFRAQGVEGKGVQGIYGGCFVANVIPIHYICI